MDDRPPVVINCTVCHRTVWNYEDYGYGSPCKHGATPGLKDVIGGPMVDPPAKVIGHYNLKTRDKKK